MPLYYFYPFGAQADDLTAIPITTQASPNSVSYQQGWTDPYEYDLSVDPLALTIPRGQMNQLFLDITTNIQEYQQYGVPQFITTSDNQGTPFPYPIYARTYYLGQVYENQVAGNVVLPGTDSSWLQISGGVVPTGTVIDFAGVTAPSGFLTCDGSQQSRTTFATLFNAITQVQTGTTTNTLPTVTGLTNATTTMYPGMPIESANFPGNTTILSITNATTVVMSQNATASSAVSIRFFNWGNGNGTTTFNLPGMQNSGTAGQGGTLAANPSAQVDVAGQGVGNATTTLALGNIPSATYTAGVPQTSTNNSGGTLRSMVLSAIGGSAGVLSLSISDNYGGGSPAAISNVQPTKIMNKCIKT